MKIHSKLFQTKVLFPLFLFAVCLISAVIFRSTLFDVFGDWARPIWKLQNELDKKFSSSLEVGKTFRVKEVKLELLRKENQRLRKILGRKGAKELLVSAVLARPPVSLYDTFLIDAGSVLGVTVGARVFVYGDIAVGEVVEVSTEVAKVKLYSSPGQVTDVLIGKENVSAKIHGTGAGNFRVKLPRGISVYSGAKVFFSEFDGGIIGVVEYIEENKEDTFQTVYIKSLVNVWSLRYLQVAV